MTDTAKEDIQAALTISRLVLMKNGMSIGVTKDKEIMFFDANYYIETRNFDGFVVKMESLVSSGGIT